MKYLTNSKILILAVFITVLFSLNALAVNLTSEARMKLKEAGTLDSYIELLKDAEIRGLNLPSEIKRSTGLAADVETTDTISVLVLLVDFSDNPESGDAVSGVTAVAFDSTLFSYGINPTGSMTEYYLENSFGTMLVRGQVHGWYRMPQLYSYYHDFEAGVGTWPNNSQGLTWDAIQTVDAAGLDFSQFDTYGPDGDPDGYIDGLLIVHSGPGFETSLDTTDIQSHKWSLGTNYQFVDNITIDDFTMQAEEFGGDQSPIGVFCHEFGHILGLPDLYDIDYVPSTSDGIGIWSLMGTGSYKNSGRVPSHFDAWSKAYLGFAVPTVVNSNIVDVELPQIESEPVIYKMYAGGYPNEYFLVENRQRVGFDEGLPGTGLLIYHVDEATTYNNVNVENYHVAVEQADGLMQLEYGNNNEGDSGDPWPGLADKRSFDDLSTPSSRVYNGAITEVSVWNISDSDSLMTANLDVSWSRPNFDLLHYSFEDPNGNGLLEPGEMIEFYFEIRNDWLTANSVTISMSCNDPSITFEDATVLKSVMYGDGEIAHNMGDPITFRIPTTVISTFDSFFVSVESDAGQFTAEFAIEQQVGVSQILIVDDDRGSSYESLYIDDLYKNLIPADIWSKQTTGSPSAVVLNNYNTVIWFTGDTSNTLLNSSDVSAMKSFLDNGGNLFLTGQGIAGELHDEDSTFLEDYLHARYGGLAFYPFQTGISGSPISDGFSLIRYFSSGNQEFTKAEYIIPVGEAIPAFAYQFYGNVTSLSYSGSNKVVFFDFGYEAIDNISSSKYASRDSVFARVLNFFGQVPTDVSDVDNSRLLPKSFVLEPNYPNPFNPMTTISYTVRNNGGGASKNTLLKIYNVLGQDIKTLVDEIQIPGHYSVEWDGTDNTGNHVGSGMYFYRLIRGNDAESRKMVFLK